MAPPTVFLGRLPLRERGWVAEQLRNETVGGALLLAAAVIALIWANSGWHAGYHDLVTWEVGPAAINLHLPLETWAADGLLAMFFFVVGLELKHELVLGSLSHAREAVVPVAAALGGMALPAIIYTIVNTTMADGQPGGWGIPMATDIAFALAVLAIVGRRLPIALRAFLLTLAVVDDLGAITVIALFYSHGMHLWWLAAAIALFACYAIAQRLRVRSPFLYIPLGLLAWYCVFQSGVHATIAGVVLGLLTRVKADPGEGKAPVDRLSHLLHPVSAGICVPLFAFFAAGVDVRSIGLLDAITTPVAIGVIVGLVVGKPLGVLAASWATARFTRASLSPDLRWRDVLAVGLLAGIGFTVALLIAGLAFPDQELLLGSGKAAVLVASVIAALIATIALRSRNRHYQALHDHEAAQSASTDGQA